jgi:hypothetical protein
MSTAVLTNRLDFSSAADTALKVAVRFWFVVAFVGQLTFAFAVASFYGLTTLRGDLSRWNKFLTHGYIPGDGIGNVALVVHLISAVVIILAGTLQLIPAVRNRFPVFHRWTGRFYVMTAFTVSLAGLYLMWVRGTVGDFSQHLGNTVLAVLIMFFAVMALRYALARDFKTHRRWALRLYFAVSASLFIRVGIFLSLFLNRGPFGFDPTTFRGPFLSFISFGQYLVPLAVLEIYFWVQERGGVSRKFAMAGSLFVFTLALGLGIFAVSMVIWVPQVKAAFDPRKSITETLSATIASSGIDAAAKQYHDLKTTESATYNFDEDQLNNLGYQLIRTKKFQEGIRIFQLNVEAYPQSSNAYDSLGEGYMKVGDKPLAVSNYEKSLQLNPKNRNAIQMLQKLNASGVAAN